MKWYRIQAFTIIVLISLLFSCSSVTGDLDDQSPALFVTIVNNTGTLTSATCPVYLIYYTNNNWTNPWLQHGSTSDTLVNPVIGTLSTYIMAFLDTNNNGVPDAGVDFCTGYVNADHSASDVLTKLDFMPLEWKFITITLEAGQYY